MFINAKPLGIRCYDIYSILVSGPDIDSLSFDALMPTLVNTANTSSNTQILELRGIDGLPPNRNLDIRLDASNQQGIAQFAFSKSYDACTSRG